VKKQYIEVDAGGVAGVLGTTATGMYAACMTVALFSTPLILGISNALSPRAAQAFHVGGGAELRRVVLQTTLLLGMAMALFCALVFVAGEDIMDVLYDGSQYQGHGHAVAVLALAMLATALGMPASNGLAAAERPDVVFKVSLIAVAVSVVLVPALVAAWGLVGAAYGFLAGNVAGSVGRWLAFSTLVMTDDSRSPSAAVLGVLRQFTRESNDTDWVIEPLNEGAQASVFAVRTKDRQPVWLAYHDLVVKLYKPTTRKDTQEVRTQFESMSRFHATLAGSTINGWQIHAPVPLYQCDRPFALVMTMVPGRSLNSCLGTASQLTMETLESIADTVIAVMERCWSIDAQMHGDFNFDNILCDLDSRSLSFVDPGVRENAFLCDGATRQWYPASRDLAHMLYETAVGVKRTIGNPSFRQRQRCLAESVVRAFTKRVAPADHKNRLLDEIHACTQIHLECLQPSWTPRGLWRILVRQLATRRIDKLLARLRTEQT